MKINNIKLNNKYFNKKIIILTNILKIYKIIKKNLQEIINIFINRCIIYNWNKNNF